MRSEAFTRKSIGSRLLFYFISLILLPILTLGILGNIVYIGSFERAANAHTVQMIDQVKKNVEFYIKDMENITCLIAMEPETIAYMGVTRDTPAQRRRSLETSIKSRLGHFTQLHPEISGILIVNQNDFDVSNEMARVARNPLTLEAWYLLAAGQPDTTHLISKPIGRNIRTRGSYGADDVVSIVRAIRDPDTGDVKGVVLIDMMLSIIDQTIKDIKLGKSGFLYIMDSNGDIVYAPTNPIVYRVNPKWIAKASGNSIVKEIRGVRYQIIYSESAYTKWKTVGTFSLNESLSEITGLINFSVLIGSLTLVCAIIVAMFFTSSIVKPINKLRLLMKRAQGGNFDVYAEAQRDAEIDQLGQSFNAMIAEIRNLIQQVYLEQKSKREAELKILQAQIKPHFLYNTLDTIQWMAQQHQADDIVQIVGALTSLFRIGLSRGKEMLKVYEELEHVRSYLIIQQARYEDKLEYRIVCEDEEVLNYSVIKLILQPLVENAIYHGIKQKRGMGRIVIGVRKAEGKLIFTVTDDGAGMSPQKLEELREMLRERDPKNPNTGYGIFNVNERIRLLWGNEYGLRFVSEPGKGTTVEVWHPLIER